MKEKCTRCGKLAEVKRYICLAPNIPDEYVCAECAEILQKKEFVEADDEQDEHNI